MPIVPIQIYSFFAGVGFLDLGFQNANFDIAFVNEYNERFLYAYQYARRNDSHVPHYGYSHLDIRSFLSDDTWNATFPDYRQKKNILIGFIGGPPCPDFSVAGRNEGKEGKNGQLTSIYVELIIKRKPDFFLLENVKGLYRTKKHREFYDSIKSEDISMILMPHAWATDKDREKEDKQKIITLVSSYGNAFNCPVVFANAVGEVEQMAGITGKLMNPQKYKLNGNSIIYSDGKVTNFAGKSESLSVECEVKPRKRTQDITFYGDWIDEGSALFRNVVIPLDVKKGVKMYNKSKESDFER